MVIKVPTSDAVIWNTERVISDICFAMHSNKNIVIDLLNEGPDITSTKLYDRLEYCSALFSYDLSNITINTCNLLESHNTISINYKMPEHFINSTVDALLSANTAKLPQIKKFGLFVGRSNAPRLTLATFMHKYKEHLVHSFHYDYLNDFHTTNIGLEDIIRNYATANVQNETKFLTECPIKLDKTPVTYPMLSNQHNDISEYYPTFFVEIVCETYFSGSTFFPTEKIWRPIMLKTPFIVQGPQWFLKNLKDLGFQTFDRWWDEGYSEDPHDHAITEIKTVIDFILNKSDSEIRRMYIEMQDVLNHNYNTLVKLRKKL